ncbi:MAG: PKD domain-containing protein [Bacteroidia bacterium]|nr:PKD domain-containing protein [Bacteroidia bacterium]
MKKFLPLFFAIFITVLGANAQSIESAGKSFPVIKNSSRIGDIRDVVRTATCGPDTNQYTLFKATAANGLNLNNATSATGLGQYFDVPLHPITIYGFNFYGFTNSSANDTLNVTCTLFDAKADSTPNTVLASAILKVDTTAGATIADFRRTVIFTTPITVATPFLVAISNPSPISLLAVTSDWGAGDGAGENLGFAQFGTTWVSGADVTIGASSYDADLLIEPIVSFDATASIGASACVPQNAPFTFTNTSSSVFSSRFYNLFAFASHFSSTPDSTFFWDLGDGSTTYGNTPTHTYTSGATSYSPQVFGLLLGYTSACIDSAGTTFSSGAAADAAFVVGTQTGGNVAFVDNSPAAETWSWNFGDGGTSTVQSPSHTYTASGVYNVMLVVTSCGTADTTTQEISVILTGLEEDLLDKALSVYPNPSAAVFNVEMTLNKVSPVSIAVFNIVGQQLSQVNLGNVLNVNHPINLAGQEKGIYLLQVTVGNHQVTRRISVE